MRRQRFANISKLCSTVGRFGFLIFPLLAGLGIAYAQPGAAESEIQKQPYLIERSDLADGKRDPRVRIYLLFGELRENCTVWRFETSTQSNGHAMFELKEPGDKNVVLKSDSSDQHLELVLGDVGCSYRISIERLN
jgi:hypothetical protein